MTPNEIISKKKRYAMKKTSKTKTKKLNTPRTSTKFFLKTLCYKLFTCYLLKEEVRAFLQFVI